MFCSHHTLLHGPHSARQDPIQQLIIPLHETLVPTTSAIQIPPIRKVPLKRELKMTVIFDTIEPNLGVLALLAAPSRLRHATSRLGWLGTLAGLPVTAVKAVATLSPVACAVATSSVIPFDSEGFWKIQSIYAAKSSR